MITIMLGRTSCWCRFKDCKYFQLYNNFDLFPGYHLTLYKDYKDYEKV